MKSIVKRLCGNSYRLTAAVLLFAMLVVSFCGCGDSGTDDKHGNNSGDDSAVRLTSGDTKKYTVSLNTAGGMALSGVDVYIYTDDTLSDLKEAGKTDEDGLVSFELEENDGYTIVLPGALSGYSVEDKYSFSGGTAVITLSSSIITSGDITSTTLAAGDIMYDASVTDINGETVKFSEVLAEKKMILLNFWYTGCTWCWKEFPLMASVYDQYSDDIEIFALDPLDTDTVETIRAELLDHDLDLPFRVARVPYAWANTFGISAYPVSVIIDRYGLISLVEVGAITSKGAWINVFDYFTSDDYEQKIIADANDLVIKTLPTHTMEDASVVAEALGCGEYNVNLYASEDEYAWPFLTGEKDGGSCIYASNSNIDSSFAILRADVELKAGEAIGLDYFSSTESGSDILHVIVNDEDVYRISGSSLDWKSVYPCVADEDGTYSIVISYIKDSDTDDGDDTVYLRNFRILSADDIDVPTYLPREAAVSEDGENFEYVDIFLNESDGYYHVGSVDGPLLLANLTAGTTKLNEANSPYMLAYERGELVVDGVDYYDRLVENAGYASNATITGYCTVTEDLAECLKALAKVEGFYPDDPDEWLKTCKYYAAYGTDGEQFEDPIKGLTSFSAYTATLGKNVPTNVFTYDRMIYPRGLRAEFVPQTSGVYRITSVSTSLEGVEGWMFDENGEEILVYEPDERMFDSDEVSMLYYMEAGKSYYITIAFWDMYEEGDIYYDIEYEGATLEVFRLASQPYFTYQDDELSGSLNYTIAGGIDVVLGSDNIWYEDIGTDEDGNQRYGSKLYVDFTGSNGLFSNPIMSYDNVTGMIDMGGFDFRKTEQDEYIYTFFKARDFDVDATIAYFKETWGDSYDKYYESYQVEDVLAGRYHGTGEDYTEAMRAYISQVDNSSHVERNGCVLATKELTDILQMLMDKYTFENVDHSWTKLCYYYDYLGPENR